MIPQNLTENFSNLGLPIFDICSGEGRYTPECLNKWFCPQISGYFVNTALVLAIAYLVLTWLLWAYWRWVHDNVAWDEIALKMPIVMALLGGDPLEYKTKVRIELWIRDKIEKLMLGFLIILWWFYH